MASKHAKEKEPRHVRLYHWLMDTEAWLDLGPVPQAVYIRLVKRYGGPGSNNGMIPCSLLELAQEVRISKQTAMRALETLQSRGFIVQTTKGAFNIKHRHATEWLLTEFKDDRAGKSLALPSKDFARWRKSEHGSTSKPERVSGRNRSGFQKEQSPKVTMGYGSTSKPEDLIDGSTSKPLLVYQGQAVLSTPTDTVRHAEEAPDHTGRAHRSEQTVEPIEDIPARSNKPVHVSDALRGILGVGRAPAPQPSEIEVSPDLGEAQRALLRWLQGFDGPATHRKAQQNLSNVLKGEAIAEAAENLVGLGLLKIELSGRSRIYSLTEAGEKPALVHDSRQIDLENWLAETVQ